MCVTVFAFFTYLLTACSILRVLTHWGATLVII